VALNMGYEAVRIRVNCVIDTINPKDAFISLHIRAIFKKGVRVYLKKNLS
jgi:hypothetical protein